MPELFWNWKYNKITCKEGWVNWPVVCPGIWSWLWDNFWTLWDSISSCGSRMFRDKTEEAETSQKKRKRGLFCSCFSRSLWWLFFNFHPSRKEVYYLNNSNNWRPQLMMSIIISDSLKRRKRWGKITWTVLNSLPKMWVKKREAKSCHIEFVYHWVNE